MDDAAFVRAEETWRSTIPGLLNPAAAASLVRLCFAKSD
jgi:hypothetical protein